MIMELTLLNVREGRELEFVPESTYQWRYIEERVLPRPVDVLHSFRRSRFPSQPYLGADPSYCSVLLPLTVPLQV